MLVKGGRAGVEAAGGVREPGDERVRERRPSGWMRVHWGDAGVRGMKRNVKRRRQVER